MKLPPRINHQVHPTPSLSHGTIFFFLPSIQRAEHLTGSSPATLFAVQNFPLFSQREGWLETGMPAIFRARRSDCVRGSQSNVAVTATPGSAPDSNSSRASRRSTLVRWRFGRKCDFLLFLDFCARTAAAFSSFLNRFLLSPAFCLFLLSPHSTGPLPLPLLQKVRFSAVPLSTVNIPSSPCEIVAAISPKELRVTRGTFCPHLGVLHAFRLV